MKTLITLLAVLLSASVAFSAVPVAVLKSTSNANTKPVQLQFSSTKKVKKVKVKKVVKPEVKVETPKAEVKTK